MRASSAPDAMIRGQKTVDGILFLAAAASHSGRLEDWPPALLHHAAAGSEGPSGKIVMRREVFNLAAC
jgi:hypothetical protein